MNPATALAEVAVDELIRGGIREAVLCPGSRNAPLALALAAADRGRRLRLHVRIDERTAAFLALGLARGSGRAVVVACTSGTAAANFHPAVLEAHHGGVPLLVLTADRPPELRDSGANQATDQARLYGPAVRFAHDIGAPERRVGQVAYWRSMVCRALAAATAPARPGPAHLNVALREPLLPGGDEEWPEPLAGRADGGPWTRVAAGGPAAAVPVGGMVSAVETVPAGLPDLDRVLVILALGVPPPAWARGWPVVAEAGGAGQPDWVLTTGAWLLGDADFVSLHRPEAVVCVGRPTLHRAVSRLLADPSVSVTSVGAGPPWCVPGTDVSVVAAGAKLPAGLRAKGEAAAPTGMPTQVEATAQPGEPAAAGASPASRAWRGAWLAAERAVRPVIDQALDSAAAGVTGLSLARDLVAALPAEAMLVLGSSAPVRDIGLASAARPDVRVLANRGVAGIDGTVSTAIGAALADPGRSAYALIGDLTFLHDQTGLVIGPDEPRPDLTLVVANNRGGGIFHLLEAGRPEHAEDFERVFGTPHTVDLAALAAATGAAYTLVTRPDQLAPALRPVGGLRVVEVRLGRTGLRDQHARIAASVTGTLRAIPT